MLNERLHVFSLATKDMLAQFGVEAQLQEKYEVPTLKVSQYDLIVIIGLTGELKGSVVYNMSAETAKQLASSMLGGMPVLELDEMVKSAVSEFANMTSGDTLARLNRKADITPPTLVTGEKLSLSLGMKEMLMTEIPTPLGAIDIYLGAM